jgi:hypothetical protein
VPSKITLKSKQLNAPLVFLPDKIARSAFLLELLAAFDHQSVELEEL